MSSEKSTPENNDPSTTTTSSSTTATTTTPAAKKPTVILFVGMAGSGKSTLLQRTYAHTYHNTPHVPYVINMDPAVDTLGYEPHLDIRDTVNYKQVMKQYKLGPNGAIITSLNLFATKIDQIIHLLEEKAEKEQLDYVFIDTPGQIEVFTWSASGQMITEALASTFPTVLLYVVDTPRTVQPITFMSNMLYACSILYKTRLPFIVGFNKIDVQKHDFAVEWMRDFEVYTEVLQKEKTYSSSLAYSMSLVLDEFYEEISAVGVSALSGEGMNELIQSFDKGTKEYFEFYAKELEERRQEYEEKKAKKEEENVQKLSEDLKHRVTMRDSNEEADNDTSSMEDEKM
eukprot:CAMPEP_0117445110 /NCGR_PEP_ID=MMETSP0759-20121206/5615_1 /TAXON_ID=63605 /ORGANISM="Percolomonas cosmopolitus, Strain WS" /LENGTH=342 /DNA_ID=CAMNT_0005237253 /DNA_START=26 /DNA_END=1054 /DNA_ORIENTATION=-